MAEVNPKAYPLADAQLTITILDIVQQAAVRYSHTHAKHERLAILPSPHLETKFQKPKYIHPLWVGFITAGSPH
jgi:hypothetical protein